MDKIGCITIILVLLGVIALLALGPLFTMLLWNWLMPTLFGLGVINYWQALGICLLIDCLFGGLRVVVNKDAD